MRRNCSHCKEPITYHPRCTRPEHRPELLSGVALQRGRGCDRCNNTGYSGRLAIIEAMTITDEIRKAIIARASSMEIGKSPSTRDENLRQSPLTKCAKG